LARRDARAGLLFVLPALLALAALLLYPLLDTVRLSLTDDAGRFVGLANFAAVLEARLTGIALRNTIVYVGGSLVLQIVIGTAAGILLNQPLRGRAALRSLILIPWIVPGIVAATTWAWMFHYEFGILNWLWVASGLGEEPVGWLTRRDTVLPSLIAVNVWKLFPFVAVMVLAGLQAIPQSLYEAARVDGAGFLAEVRYVMLPQLKGVLLAVTLLLFIWGMNAITIIYAMTRGGPANASLITPIQIFQEAFELFQFPTASALSVLLFAGVAVVIALYVRLMTKGDPS
jgi:multiple sugar transport system permease protein